MPLLQVPESFHEGPNLKTEVIPAPYTEPVSNNPDASGTRSPPLCLLISLFSLPLFTATNIKL